MNRPFLRLLGVLLLTAGVAGCSVLSPKKDPTRFYVLTAVGAPTDGTVSSTNTLVVAVEVAGYLQNPSLVERIASNQVSYYPFDQWAQPLVEGFSQTVRANLAESGRPVVLANQTYVTRDAQRLEVRLTRFEISSGPRVQVAASWLIREQIGGNPVRQGEFQKEATFSSAPGTLQPAVAALSELLGELSRTILADLR